MGDENEEPDLSRSEPQDSSAAVKRDFVWPDDKEADQVYGIDVSQYQGDIDWPVVSGTDPAFAYVRITFGQTATDLKYKENLTGLSQFNIVKGAYHFLTPSGDPRDQIDRFVGLYEPLSKTTDLPSCVDFETYESSDGTEQWELITESERVDKLSGALDQLEVKTGRKPIIYTNGDAWRNLLGSQGDLFKPYEIWIARYGGYTDDDPDIMDGFDWWAWQFTDQGKMPGITANTVDSSILKAGGSLYPYAASADALV